MEFPRYSGLDPDSRTMLRSLASSWRDSPSRPRVSAAGALAWHKALEEWVRDRDLPLLIRRPRLGRGRLIPHPSGRSLLISDDAPAEHLFTMAVAGVAPCREEWRTVLEEQAHAHDRGTLPDFASLGYSICHVTQVGVDRGPLSARTEQELMAHSLLHLSPVNMYVVPRAFSRLGELAEFIDEMDDARAFRLAAGMP